MMKDTEKMKDDSKPMVVANHAFFTEQEREWKKWGTVCDESNVHFDAL